MHYLYYVIEDQHMRASVCVLCVHVNSLSIRLFYVCVCVCVCVILLNKYETKLPLGGGKRPF